MKNTDRVIAHVGYEYRLRDTGGRRLARRGDTVDVSEWDDVSFERAERLGVFMPVLDGDADSMGDSFPVESATVEGLAEFITSNSLNAKNTIALCDGDGILAKKVLDAERLATGGSPRAGVFKALVAVMDRSS